jgi:hypothetical protein
MVNLKNKGEKNLKRTGEAKDRSLGNRELRININTKRYLATSSYNLRGLAPVFQRIPCFIYSHSDVILSLIALLHLCLQYSTLRVPYDKQVVLFRGCRKTEYSGTRKTENNGMYTFCRYKYEAFPQ